MQGATTNGENVTVLTLVTEDVGYLPVLRETCKRFHGNLTEIRLAKFKGFNMRTRCFFEHLKGMADDAFVAVVDGYDVVCCKDLRELRADFEKLNTDIAVGYEMARDALDILRRTYIFGEGGRVDRHGQAFFLNAGVYFGLARNVRGLHEAMLAISSCDEADDQAIMSMHMASKHRPTLSFATGLVYTESAPLQDLSHVPTSAYFVHGAWLTKLDRAISGISYDARAVHQWQRAQFAKKLSLLATGLWQCFLKAKPPTEYIDVHAGKAVVYATEYWALPAYVKRFRSAPVRAEAHIGIGAGAFAAAVRGERAPMARFRRHACKADFLAPSRMRAAVVASIDFEAFRAGPPVYIFYAQLLGTGALVAACNDEGTKCLKASFHTRVIETREELVEVIMTAMLPFPFLFAPETLRTLNISPSSPSLQDRIWRFARSFGQLELASSLNLCGSLAPALRSRRRSNAAQEGERACSYSACNA